MKCTLRNLVMGGPKPIETSTQWKYYVLSFSLPKCYCYLYGRQIFCRGIGYCNDRWLRKWTRNAMIGKRFYTYSLIQNIPAEIYSKIAAPAPHTSHCIHSKLPIPFIDTAVWWVCILAALHHGIIQLYSCSTSAHQNITHHSTAGCAHAVDVVTGAEHSR